MVSPSALRRALSLFGVIAFSNLAAHAGGISATATYTDTQVSPGLYDYTLTLNNTGSTNIGTFWFGWVPGAGFLSAAPTNITNPSGWVDKTTNGNAAIQWTTTLMPLTAGQSLTGFSFESTETPGQLLLNYTGTGTGAGDPVTTSFVYIAAPLNDPGYQLAAQPAATTPEPASLALMATGSALLSLCWRQRRQLGR